MTDAMGTRTMPQRDEMVAAFLSRDGSYDGVFFTGVRTTGIFCRPTCSAKKPRKENVDFFPSTQDAPLAGFRPAAPWSRPAAARLAQAALAGLRRRAGETLDGSRSSSPGAQPGACSSVVSLPPWDDVSRLRARTQVGTGDGTDQTWLRSQSSSIPNGLRFLEWLQRCIQAVHGRSSVRFRRRENRDGHARHDPPRAHGGRVRR